MNASNQITTYENPNSCHHITVRDLCIRVFPCIYNVSLSLLAWRSYLDFFVFSSGSGVLEDGW